MNVDEARKRLAELLRGSGRAFLDSQAPSMPASSVVALRNEMESMVALFEDENFDPVSEFERRSVGGAGMLRIASEESGR